MRVLLTASGPVADNIAVQIEWHGRPTTTRYYCATSPQPLNARALSVPPPAASAAAHRPAARRTADECRPRSTCSCRRLGKPCGSERHTRARACAYPWHSPSGACAAQRPVRKKSARRRANAAPGGRWLSEKTFRRGLSRGRERSRRADPSAPCLRCTRRAGLR